MTFTIDSIRLRIRSNVHIQLMFGLCARHHKIITNITMIEVLLRWCDSCYIFLINAYTASPFAKISVLLWFPTFVMLACLNEQIRMYSLRLNVVLLFLLHLLHLHLLIWTPIINNVSNRIIFRCDVLRSEISLKFDYLRVQMSHYIKIQYALGEMLLAYSLLMPHTKALVLTDLVRLKSRKRRLV